MRAFFESGNGEAEKEKGLASFVKCFAQDSDCFLAALLLRPLVYGKILTLLSTTVDSRYLEVEGTLWNTSRYPYFDISDLQNWGKYQSNKQIS